MKASCRIPLTDAERAEIFENDAEAFQRGRRALGLLRAGQISGEQFIRTMADCQGQALSRFASDCARIARQRLSSGWAAANAQHVKGAR